MLSPLENLPDEGQVDVYVISRALTDEEQAGVRGRTNQWLVEWMSNFPGCVASESQTLFSGAVLVWGIDDRVRRETVGKNGVGISNTELDYYFSWMLPFLRSLTPPAEIATGEAFVIGDEVVPYGSRLVELIRAGLLTEDSLLVASGSMGDWRAGKLIHRIGDDPVYAPLAKRHPDQEQNGKDTSNQG